MEFSEVYEKYEPDIRVAALSQRVPGLDYDDVMAEMVGCLWKAWQTYTPGPTTFGSYWWSVWLNRRNDLTALANRMKRPKHVLISDVSILGQQSYEMSQWPEPPAGTAELERRVWDLLASGEPRSVVLEETGMSKRRYYDIIRGWRTEEVERSLRHMV